MKRFYLLGRGISHSLSPPAWNRVFAGLGVPAQYGLLDVDTAGLPDALGHLHADDVAGYNVTMPYKAWAAQQAQLRGVDVDRAGTANWLTVRDSLVSAANTDIEGARALLDEISVGDRVLVLGAGGTAAAMLVALEGRAGRVVVANRTAERAARLVRRASGWLDDVAAVEWDERTREAALADLIVNTTPLGMRDELSPLEKRPEARIYDVVYRATPTPLQRQAAAWGLPFTDGLAHLEDQAVALVPHFGLPDHAAELVRTSLRAAAGRAPLRWEVPATKPQARGAENAGRRA